MALKQNQTHCKCGKSVETCKDLDNNGTIKIVGKSHVPHMFCNSCGADWGKFSCGSNKSQPIITLLT